MCIACAVPFTRKAGTNASKHCAGPGCKPCMTVAVMLVVTEVVPGPIRHMVFVCGYEQKMNRQQLSLLQEPQTHAVGQGEVHMHARTIKVDTNVTALKPAVYFRGSREP